MATTFRLAFSCFILQAALLLCVNGKDTKPNIVILFADDVSMECRLHTSCDLLPGRGSGL